MAVTLKPEEQAREKIDELLTRAGWMIQDRDTFNRNAGVGVAVREFSLPNGPCDYLLFVGGKAAGVIEAKKAGTTLSAVADQSGKYMEILPDHLARWSDQLFFDYESNGEEVLFRDTRDPLPRSRRIFAFHKPETLLEWAQQEDSLRGRLRRMPPLEKSGLRDCQIEAIEGTPSLLGLEPSLAQDNPRTLLQMATGAGKTFTACTFSYRLIKHAKARRILFLVDRNNLGDQTLKEFQNFHPSDSPNSFTKQYIAQHLHTKQIDPDAKVVITTIQRLYSMLKGEEILEEDEERSAFEIWGNDDGEIPPITYNPYIPIETFDFIITDECHRSIYGLWRQVLEYFDAHIIGLTATPSIHTLGFFNKNLVAEYPYERSVADGVNVGYEVYRIRTEVSEAGGLIEQGYTVPVRDKRTRAQRYQHLDADMQYQASQLDKSVTNPNQIRTIIECYRNSLFTELFPGRSGEWVPKTLIFAKDDNHAEEIVHIVRQVFGEGNEFAKKITYKLGTGEDPKTLIKSFRVDPMPRIAVTVDMIATGTDIKPVEVLIFMRDVKSEGYYEQMKGRGVRSIKDADLKQVTPDAQTKTRFVLIDAVGVSESCKTASQPLERKRSVAFDKLLDQLAAGRRDEDALSSLAGRLAALERKIDLEDQARISETTGGTSLRELANKLLDAIDPDTIQKQAVMMHGPEPTLEQSNRVQERLRDIACEPFDNPMVRQLLKDIKQKADIVIDEITTDRVLSAGYDLKKAEETVSNFKRFLEEHKDNLLALQILYNLPYAKRKLTYAAIKELAAKLSDPPYYLMAADVWQAYRRLEASKVRGAPVDRMLTEIIALVRFSIGQTEVLEPFGMQVEQRFNLWVGRQKKAGKVFTEEQLAWLKLLKEYIAANAEVTPKDLMEAPSFVDLGGLVKARTLFGEQLNPMLDELSEALVG